jgi:hypothetical protein
MLQEISPPAFVPQGGASRKQVAPLWQIPRNAGPPFVRRGKEGFALSVYTISLKIALFSLSPGGRGRG